MWKKLRKRRGKPERGNDAANLHPVPTTSSSLPGKKKKKGNSNNNAVRVAVAQQCSKGEISSPLQLKVALFHKSGSGAFHEVLCSDAAGQNASPSSTWCSAAGTPPGSTDPLLPLLRSLLLSCNFNCRAEMGSQLPVQWTLQKHPFVCAF